MLKYKKSIKIMTAAELSVEAKKLAGEILQAKIDKIAGRAKNLRQAFILRKKLAIVNTYASLNR